MRPHLFTAILSATSLLAFADDPAPVMTEISQKAANPGEIVTVSGVGLSSRNVEEIYLTDHKFDMRVKVLVQTDTTVQFRVPPFAKPGRMQLLFLSKGEEPKLLEQPVFLVIEDPATEIAAARPAPEPGKPESAKTAESGAEQAKPEPANEPPKVEQTKKVDPVNLDLTKVDQGKPVLAKPDLTKPDLTNQDLTKPDLAKPDLTKPDPRQPNL